jgi:hypothetical protein
MTMPSNKAFIEAIFGVDAPWCHVTDFTHDPSNIPSGIEHLIAWKGDYFSRYNFTAQSNQYFTISTFYADDKGTARRRKALYRQTHCIVLDDVKEKLVQSEVDKLPPPSWVLETSAGSEQWGYILTTPSQDRARVENLLDGLIANGLAPDGIDSGMKGVTRYVRLPEGVNNKAKRFIDGQPFKCRMLSWSPFNTVTLEQLAAPLSVNLDAERRDSRVDGAAAVDDHPVLELTDIIHIKEIRSDGRFDITCPWVEDHTGQEDSGSAIFTNKDGTLGFKCHHGNCQEKTGNDLLKLIEREHTGFKAHLAKWQVMRSFADITGGSVNMPFVPAPPVFDIPAPPVTQPAPVPSPPQAPVSTIVPDEGFDSLINMLRREPPQTVRQRQLAGEVLKAVDGISVMEKQHVQEQVRDIMRWSKPDFKVILSDLRSTWYAESAKEINFFDDVIFIAEQNQFFDRRKRIFYTPEAYQNTYAHLSADARKEALQGGMVTKVDKIDFAPLKPPVFVEGGITYGNSWHNESLPMGVEGDASPWLDHIDRIGWGEHKKHLLQWMAFTIRHPDQKINHMIILGSGEGAGKDWILAPLTVAMGQQQYTINGDDLLSDFNSYVLSTKYLHINEAELGDRREAMMVSNKLKPLAAAPPKKINLNEKGVKGVQVRNILSASMTTNSQLPVRLNGPSRRMFCLWSDFDVRDATFNVRPEWKKFWKEHWHWMDNGGAEVCIWYLRNKVDLSDFDAGAAPPMTEFLRDIIEASKSPLELTVDAMVASKFGELRFNLVTPEDIHKSIHLALMTDPQNVYVDMSKVTPRTITTCMNQSSRYIGFRTTHGMVYAVRSLIAYRGASCETICDYYTQDRPFADPVVTVQNGTTKVVHFDTTVGQK